MGLGMPLNVYERRVTPMNRYFHEQAELLRLYRQGILPIDQEGADADADAGPGASGLPSRRSDGHGLSTQSPSVSGADYHVRDRLR